MIHIIAIDHANEERAFHIRRGNVYHLKLIGVRVLACGFDPLKQYGIAWIAVVCGVVVEQELDRIAFRQISCFTASKRRGNRRNGRGAFDRFKRIQPENISATRAQCVFAASIIKLIDKVAGLERHLRGLSDRPLRSKGVGGGT